MLYGLLIFALLLCCFVALNFQIAATERVLKLLSHTCDSPGKLASTPMPDGSLMNTCVTPVSRRYSIL